MDYHEGRESGKHIASLPGQRSEEDPSSSNFHDGPGNGTAGTDVSIPACSVQ